MFWPNFCLVILFQNNLVASYLPEHSRCFNLYTSQSEGRQRKPSGHDLLLQQPQVTPVHALTAITAEVYRGISDTIDEIGGIGALLFLFAKVSTN